MVDQFVIGSRSYQQHVSRRRSSVASTVSLASSMGADSAPSSPVDAQVPLSPLPLSSVSAIRYTYVCNDCGFGTDLLSSYMPHISNPCDQPAKITWGKL
ncbi:hypothetical protein H4R99_003824 [Coemansia sp. RSA 1722]|nr:hypothetical protein LPJ57_001301 [Coemansia sp. RSA 486]KAJ2232700.1 hypothetical protein IWW45_004767 [Coemansia sp. RSA 485]KAJ2598132.1 hypothetical protein GGF39_002769 [Coemansia sp. RSA 1721]KAJ2599138.1 hypothetical protein H4R99_003824 [Coemansia sp. RSA 1722]KAJ2636690.1 hypothetical protein GGF40_002848 [Coemansia sp. RSA 1286]